MVSGCFAAPPQKKTHMISSWGHSQKIRFSFEYRIRLSPDELAGFWFKMSDWLINLKLFSFFPYTLNLTLLQVPGSLNVFVLILVMYGYFFGMFCAFVDKRTIVFCSGLFGWLVVSNLVFGLPAYIHTTNCGPHLTHCFYLSWTTRADWIWLLFHVHTWRPRINIYSNTYIYTYIYIYILYYVLLYIYIIIIFFLLCIYYFMYYYLYYIYIHCYIYILFTYIIIIYIYTIIYVIIRIYIYIHVYALWLLFIIIIIHFHNWFYYYFLIYYYI